MSGMALMNKQILQTRWNTWRWILIFFNVFLSWPGSSKTFHRPAPCVIPTVTTGFVTIVSPVLLCTMSALLEMRKYPSLSRFWKWEFAVWRLCEKTPVVRWNDCRYRLWTATGPTRPFVEIPRQPDHGTHHGKADSQGNREKQASGLPRLPHCRTPWKTTIDRKRLQPVSGNSQNTFPFPESRSRFRSGGKNPGNGKTIDYLV